MKALPKEPCKAISFTSIYQDKEFKILVVYLYATKISTKFILPNKLGIDQEIAKVLNLNGWTEKDRFITSNSTTIVTI